VTHGCDPRHRGPHGPVGPRLRRAHDGRGPGRPVRPDAL